MSSFRLLRRVDFNRIRLTLFAKTSVQSFSRSFTLPSREDTSFKQWIQSLNLDEMNDDICHIFQRFHNHRVHRQHIAVDHPQADIWS